MKKIILSFLLLLSLTVVFAQTNFELDMNNPMLSICNNLKQVRLTFEDENFQGTEYENLTEIPPELLSVINAQLSSNLGENQTLEGLNEIVFSAEIKYNNSLCFTGSFMFNNSELQFFKLYPDPLAGQDDKHITFFANLYPLEELFTDWINLGMNMQTTNVAELIILYVKSFFKLISSLIGGDFYIKPLSGVFKVINSMRAFLNIDFTQLNSLMELNNLDSSILDDLQGGTIPPEVLEQLDKLPPEVLDQLSNQTIPPEVLEQLLQEMN